VTECIQLPSLYKYIHCRQSSFYLRHCTTHIPRIRSSPAPSNPCTLINSELTWSNAEEVTYKFVYHLLRNTKMPQQGSHDNARYPRLIRTVIKPLRTKALQEEISDLGIVCVGDRLRSLSFQDIDNKFLSKMAKLKSLNIYTDVLRNHCSS
jgi:hypothetical protein